MKLMKKGAFFNGKNNTDSKTLYSFLKKPERRKYKKLMPLKYADMQNLYGSRFIYCAANARICSLFEAKY